MNSILMVTSGSRMEQEGRPVYPYSVDQKKSEMKKLKYGQLLFPFRKEGSNIIVLVTSNWHVVEWPYLVGRKAG